MFQKIASFLFCIFLLLPTACSKQLPDQMPDFGMNTDELEFNKYISLSAPEECNSFQAGNEVCLEVKNLTEQVWNFNITSDILIYRYENEEWEKLSDNMENIGATELILGPKGEFPLDARLAGVLPDVEHNQFANLRIILIVHKRNGEQVTQSKGAFVDVVLKP